MPADCTSSRAVHDQYLSNNMTKAETAAINYVFILTRNADYNIYECVQIAPDAFCSSTLAGISFGMTNQSEDGKKMLMSLFGI